MTSKKLIKVSEYYKSPISLEEDERFSIAELEILETVFKIHSDYFWIHRKAANTDARIRWLHNPSKSHNKHNSKNSSNQFY